MAPIRAVLFDVDGVCVQPQMQFGVAPEKRLSIPLSQIETFFTSDRFVAALRGKDDVREILPAYIAGWGWPDSLDQFLTMWHEAENLPHSETLALVSELKRRGFSCCLATNQEKQRASYIKDVMGFAAIFDQLFFSCELGCLKDSLEYFRKAGTALGLSPKEILFFDDSAGNIETARAAGWVAERYVDHRQCVRDLERITGISLLRGREAAR